MVSMLTGMLIDQFIPGLALGLIAVKFYRRFRDNRPDGYTLHALYWLGLFLRGFSDAFGRNQISVLMTGGLGALSGTTPFQSAFSSQSMEGGALKGAGYAMERLSHFYMDMAEEIYPVIEVDATRQVNFIVQKGTALKLKTPS